MSLHTIPFTFGIVSKDKIYYNERMFSTNDILPRSKKQRVLFVVVLILLFLFVLISVFRLRIMFFVASGGSTIKRIDTIKDELTDNPEWLDDYYTLYRIDDRTYAIGELRYWQRNINYLILGDDKAILFDFGPGIRNIIPIVESLTDLPIISMVSHLHFDHIGNIDKLENVAFAKSQLPNLYKDKDGTLKPKTKAFYGKLEGHKKPEIQISKVLETDDDMKIDLGNRVIEVIAGLPGHSTDSIALYDPNATQLFIGDTIIVGPLIARKGLLAGSDLQQYKESMSYLVQRVSDKTLIYTAHNVLKLGLQELTYNDLVEFNNFLQRPGLKNKFFPRFANINEKIQFIY